MPHLPAPTEIPPSLPSFQYNHTSLGAVTTRSGSGGAMGRHQGVTNVVFRMECAPREGGGICRKKALVIGIDEFLWLEGREEGASDAGKMAEVIRRLGGDTTILTNSEATKEGILNTVKIFSDQLRPTAVTVFISSYCFEVNGEHVVGCYDTRMDNPSSHLKVSDIIKASKSFLSTVIIDPSYATTLQRLTIMNMLKGVFFSAEEGDDDESSPLVQPAPVQNLPLVGVELADFTSRGISGVKIVALKRNSSADRAGLKPGDVIIALHTATIRTRQDFRSTLMLFNPGDAIDITVAPANGTAISTRTLELE